MIFNAGSHATGILHLRFQHYLVPKLVSTKQSPPNKSSNSKMIDSRYNLKSNNREKKCFRLISVFCPAAVPQVNTRKIKSYKNKLSALLHYKKTPVSRRSKNGSIKANLQRKIRMHLTHKKRKLSTLIWLKKYKSVLKQYKAILIKVDGRVFQTNATFRLKLAKRFSTAPSN